MSTVKVTCVPVGTRSGLVVTSTVSGSVVVVVAAIEVVVLDGGLLVVVVGLLDEVLAEFPPPHEAIISATKLTPTAAYPKRFMEAF